MSSLNNTAEEDDLMLRAAEWLDLDPDWETRREMQSLVHQKNFHELKIRLIGRMVFGTAGLRARMGAGYTRMNNLTVIQTSQGLAAYLIATFPGAKERGVVVGRDTRNNSSKFALTTAATFTAMGIPVHAFRSPVHTPLVPFAVTRLGAVAGVMITASHNPKEDNGYKVYLGNGCQIVPPHDCFIAHHINQNFVPVTQVRANTSSDEVRSTWISDEVQKAYHQKIAELTNLSSPLPAFVYTPLHGVGFRPFVRAIQYMCGKRPEEWNNGDPIPFHVVSEQMYPDAEFPTVAFPNPEEAGALDLAFRTANDLGVNLIIANDPDADRLAVAEKVPLPPLIQDGPSGILQTSHWHHFTGNQVGMLLASYILDSRPEGSSGMQDVMIRSAVSTEMIDYLATKKKCKVIETLTGFKWIGSSARQLRAEGHRVLFGFEEALGYMFPSIILDKDGVSAAAMFLAATAKWREQSLTPWQKLQELYAEYGCYAEANTYLKSPSLEITTRVFNDIRACVLPDPSYMNGSMITRWRDLTTGLDTKEPDQKPRLHVDHNSQMITAWTGENLKFTARASGTEPKIKLYLEAFDPSMSEAELRVAMALENIVDRWFTPERYGLTPEARRPNPQ